LRISGAQALRFCKIAAKRGENKARAQFRAAPGRRRQSIFRRSGCWFGEENASQQKSKVFPRFRET
jgi:hypothetical protein